MRLRKQGSTRENKYNRGQAMLLIALAFVGLVGFLGLAIDAGIVFAHIGHLRRGVAAAALAAANQIRQGWSIDTVTKSAEELILLNLPADSASDLHVLVQTCVQDSDIQGCSGPIARKLARVQADLRVNLAFLPIVGWDSVEIGSNAISEAASVDLVLVIDNSTSMAYEAPEGDPMRDPANCNPIRACQPFEKVREAARLLVDNLFEGFDQVSLITFNRFAGATQNYLTKDEFPLDLADWPLTTDLDDIRTALNNMRVYGNLPSNTCNKIDEGDFRGCMRTNTAAGIRLAGIELTSPRARQESVKVVVLLSDGLANAAYSNPFVLGDPDKWYCPPEYWMDPDTKLRVDGYEGPWCADGDPEIGYVNLKYGDDTVRDPDDAARRFSDWIACLPQGENEDCASIGLGAVIFVIGLGEELIELDYIAPRSDVGGQLLRYIARVGYNGNPQQTTDDPCSDTPNLRTPCGNYYFTPDGDDLNNIFKDIADRIFTRLTH